VLTLLNEGEPVWPQAAEMLWHILPWDRPERHQRVEAHRVSAA